MKEIIDQNTGASSFVQEGFKEELQENIYEKVYSDCWMLMHKNMSESNKHNLMVSAFECGNRLDRRDQNI
jgi:hypothetical protein